jgi:hypothetical protein
VETLISKTSIMTVSSDVSHINMELVLGVTEMPLSPSSRVHVMMSDVFTGYMKREQLGHTKLTAWYLTFERGSYPGPEQCSLVRVNELLIHNKVASFISHSGQGLWNFDDLIA